MQGTAAAYDLARFGDAERVLFLDSDLPRAQKSADRVNRLTGTTLCSAKAANATNLDSMVADLAGASVVLSCVPYHYHQDVVKAALAAGVNVVDLGNDTDVALETLGWHDQFVAKNITYVPDTGLAPGLVNSMALAFMEQLDVTDEVHLYCGGLPRHPKPPFNYSLSFSLEGLVGEYIDEAIAIRDHQVVRLETLEELEELEIPGLGLMEAFTTSSGTSTAPFTLKDKVRSYEYKTLRFPGHCKLMKVFQEFGFWGEEPLKVNGTDVVPFDFFCQLMEEKLIDPTDTDFVVIHAVAKGTKDGKAVTLTSTVIDYQDEQTGFKSMERLTGFSCAIAAIEVANGRCPKGGVRYENAFTGKTILDAFVKRGIEIKTVRS
jgi:lysine 6-dehydrogenase